MQTLFSIILPLLAIRLFLNPVPSLSLSSPSPPPLTATAQYSYLNHIPAFSLSLHSPFIITIPSIRRQHPSQYSFHSSSLWRCRNPGYRLPLICHLDLPLCKHSFQLYSLFWPFAFFLIRFLLCPSRLPVLLHSLPLPITPISIT